MATPDVPAPEVVVGSSDDGRFRLVDLPDRRLFAAQLSGFVGGVLTLANGAILVGEARYPVLLGVVPSTGVEQGLGALGILVGLIVMSASIYLFPERDSHIDTGIGLLILGVLSLPAGGGFFVGLALTLAAALLALSVPPRPHYAIVPGDVRACTNCGRLEGGSSPNACPRCQWRLR